MRNAEFETREESDEKIIQGYFSRFDDVYEIWQDTTERIDPNAFDETLNRDIVSLWNHDSNIPLGRTANGSLELKVDNVGLYGTVRINEDDSAAVDAYARIKRGDVKQCSFGFEILDEEINRENGKTEFVIKKIRLHEVSPVTFPAYPKTSIEARTKQVKDIESRKFEEKKLELIEKYGGKDAKED